MKQMQKTTFSDINFADFSTLFFKVNHVFIKDQDNVSKKIVIVEK